MVVLETVIASAISGFIMSEVAKANIRTHEKRKRKQQEKKEEQSRKEQERQQVEEIAQEILHNLEREASEHNEKLERENDEIERERVMKKRRQARKHARKRKEEENILQEEEKQAEKTKQHSGTLTEECKEGPLKKLRTSCAKCFELQKLKKMSTSRKLLLEDVQRNLRCAMFLPLEHGPLASKRVPKTHANMAA